MPHVISERRLSFHQSYTEVGSLPITSIESSLKIDELMIEVVCSVCSSNELLHCGQPASELLDGSDIMFKIVPDLYIEGNPWALNVYSPVTIF